MGTPVPLLVCHLQTSILCGWGLATAALLHGHPPCAAACREARPLGRSLARRRRPVPCFRHMNTALWLPVDHLGHQQHMLRRVTKLRALRRAGTAVCLSTTSWPRLLLDTRV